MAPLVLNIKFSFVPSKKEKNPQHKSRFIACLHFYPLLLNYSEKLKRQMQKRMKRGSRGEKKTKGNHKMINKVALKEGHNHTL